MRISAFLKAAGGERQKRVDYRPLKATTLCFSNCLSQSFGHAGLPAWAGSFPASQSIRRQPQGNRREGIPGFGSATRLEHFGSSLLAKNLWQDFARLTRARKGLLRPDRILTIRSFRIALALHTASPRVCWPYVD